MLANAKGARGLEQLVLAGTLTTSAIVATAAKSAWHIVISSNECTTATPRAIKQDASRRGGKKKQKGAEVFSRYNQQRTNRRGERVGKPATHGTPDLTNVYKPDVSISMYLRCDLWVLKFVNNRNAVCRVKDGERKQGQK